MAGKTFKDRFMIGWYNIIYFTYVVRDVTYPETVIKKQSLCLATIMNFCLLVHTPYQERVFLEMVLSIRLLSTRIFKAFIHKWPIFLLHLLVKDEKCCKFLLFIICWLSPSTSTVTYLIFHHSIKDIDGDFEIMIKREKNYDKIS